MIPSAKNPGGIADTIHVGISGFVRSIGVGCDIEHTYIGDLRLELEGPAGERALLHNMTGGGADDLKRQWTSAESAALAAFVGSGVRGDWVLRVSDHLGQDTGRLNEWTLEIDLAADAQTIETSATPRLDIPDADASGVASHLAINEEGTVQALEVEADITHGYVGDLRIELVAPSGERAILHDRQARRSFILYVLGAVIALLALGGGQNDLALRLDSTESERLRALVGQPMRGNWVLRVADLEPWDEGTLDRWSLTVTYSGPSARPSATVGRSQESEAEAAPGP